MFNRSSVTVAHANTSGIVREHIRLVVKVNGAAVETMVVLIPIDAFEKFVNDLSRISYKHSFTARVEGQTPIEQ